MPRTYNLFISHAWQYNDDYYTVVNWLSQSSLDYRNYSVPQHDPLDVRTNAGLENALTDIIKNWMRVRNTVEYLGLWEQIHNQTFKLVEFERLKTRLEQMPSSSLRRNG